MMRDLFDTVLFYLRESFLTRWILASIFGWSVGLYAAALVISLIGGIIGLLLGGAVTGAVAGLSQWWALHDLVEWDARRWIGMSALGGCSGALLTFIVAIVGTVLGLFILLTLASGIVIPLFLLGAVFGGILGTAQSTALQALFGDSSGWWIIANLFAGALCGALSFTLSLNSLPIFCSPGPLIFGLITGYTLLRLLRAEGKEDFFS